MNEYPFKITDRILNEVTEISRLVGIVSVSSKLTISPTLRRTNRINTIYSSLAIEQNTLSIDQVTAVISGKRVIAPPKDIAEVKNAYEIYEHLDEFDPYSVDALLFAHGIMMRGLVSESGMFRTKPVGVVDAKGNVLHFGTLPQYVPDLVMKLLSWVKNSALPMLIKSCVFHYEFEVIHPFSDGNGRVGRLWYTLLLSKWNPIFAWIPVESIIHDRQSEYYKAINDSNDAADSTAFIEFVLSAIKDALLETMGDNKPNKSGTDKNDYRWSVISDFLNENNYILNADVRRLLNVSSATANRILSGFVSMGKLVKIRKGKTWVYIKG
ncbi:MAG: Fic family protein [Eubacterium sp.]